MTNSRRKGADFERKVARWLTTAGLPSRRTGYEQAQHSNNAPDVTVEGVPVWIECKIGSPRYVRSTDALLQAQREMPGPHWIPAAVSKMTRQPVRVLIFYDDAAHLGLLDDEEALAYYESCGHGQELQKHPYTYSTDLATFAAALLNLKNKNGGTENERDIDKTT